MSAKEQFQTSKFLVIHVLKMLGDPVLFEHNANAVVGRFLLLQPGTRASESSGHAVFSGARGLMGHGTGSFRSYSAGVEAEGESI